MRAQHLFVVATAALLATTSAQASVEISANATKNMNCVGGVCTPTAKNAVLNATDLANMLAASDVKVVTGSGAVTITVSSSFSWTSTHRLTLDAFYNVSFRAPLVVAGQGAVTIVTNDGGTGGDLLFFPGANLDFWDLGSSLMINGDSYILAGDIATLGNDFSQHKGSGFFALANDYDAGKDFKYRGPPIPAVSGAFEGLGHTIKNLTVKGTSCANDHNVSLISSIAETGVARDLHLDNVSVSSGAGRNVGGLAGTNYGTISNVTVTGRAHVESGYAGTCWPDGNVGGLVGVNAGIITKARTNVKVTAGYKYPYEFGSYAGGLVGMSSEGSIDLSSSAGSVTATKTSFIGGLVGFGSFISRSFSTANVDTYAYGNTSGGVGGALVGWGGNIVNSYASGSVSAMCSAGLIGKADYPVGTSYATGIAYSGFAGCVDDQATFTDDYWDMDTSGAGMGCLTGGCTGVTGLTDAQLRSALPAGFDPAIWGHKKNINNGYPYLMENPPPQ